MTVRADIRDGVQAPDVSRQIWADLEALRAKLPVGYRLEMGGSIEESAKANTALFAIFPAMIVVMLVILMFQLQSFSRLALTLLTAPLGLIGATVALLVSGMPFGFVTLLGLIALAGMIIRNTVILVDQIEHDVAAGSYAPPGDHRSHRAPGAAGRAHRARGHPGDDSAVALGVLGIDGRRHHGRLVGGHDTDDPVPAGAVCALVPPLARCTRLRNLSRGSPIRSIADARHGKFRHTASEQPHRTFATERRPATRGAGTVMKEVLGLATFALGALCFVTFVTTVKPTAIGVIQAAPDHCRRDIFRFAGMRRACLRSSVRRPQAAVTWRC